MDPYSVLGVVPGAGVRDVAAAYREQAKRWHPDRGGGEEADRRMAEINAAYDLLRAQALHPAPAAAAAEPAPSRGTWLPDHVRRALGPELVAALGSGEAVRLVTPASTWASPRAVLAVTDRRLLWLLDDAPVGRVRSLPLRDVATVGLRVHRPRRRSATVTLRTVAGRRHSFAELRPHTAAAIERQLRRDAG